MDENKDRLTDAACSESRTDVSVSLQEPVTPQMVGQAKREAEELADHARFIERTLRRCNGKHGQCKNAPIRGGTVCRFHGGAQPATRAAANRRLLALAEPVIEVFEEIVEGWRAERCEACGRPSGDPSHVIRVGKLVLDRTGFGPTANIRFEKAEPASDASLDWLTADELQTISNLYDTAKRRMRAGEPRPTTRRLALPPSANVADGEILPDGELSDG